MGYKMKKTTKRADLDLGLIREAVEQVIEDEEGYTISFIRHLEKQQKLIDDIEKSEALEKMLSDGNEKN